MSKLFHSSGSIFQYFTTFAEKDGTLLYLLCWNGWGEDKALTEGAVTTEAGSLLQYFITLTENVARTLEYLVGVPSKAASSGRKEKQVQINIQKTLEYLGDGNQVDP